MTEQRLVDLFTALSAFRLALIRHAGTLVVVADSLEACGLDHLAESLHACSRELAAGIEALSRIADLAQDETAVMTIDDVADQE